MSPKQYDLLIEARKEFPFSAHRFLWGTFHSGSTASIDLHEWTWLRDGEHASGVKFEVFCDLQGNFIQTNK